MASFATRRRRSLHRFSCVANGVYLWRHRSLRFTRRMAASLTASFRLRCKRRMPVTPSVPWLRSPHDGVAHCLATPASQKTCSGGAVGPSASLVTRRRRSVVRFSCVASDVCLWRRRFLRFARHTTASPIAPLLLRRKRRVPLALSIPSRRSSHDGVAHCNASLASQTTGACGAVGSFALLVTRRCRPLPRFSCVANDACLWRRRSLRFARHMTASLIATLLLHRKRRVPMAPSVPSLRSSHDDVSHYFASLVMRTARACWPRRFARHSSASLTAPLLLRCKRCVPVAPSLPSLRSSHGDAAHYFASLVIQTARALAPLAPALCSSHIGVAHCFASPASQMTRSRWRRQSLRFARHMASSLSGSLLLRRIRRVRVAPSVPSLRSSHDDVAHYVASLVMQTACALAPLARRFARQTTASLIASLIWRRKRPLPVAPSVPPICS